jgi:hypothetical protein
MNKEVTWIDVLAIVAIASAAVYFYNQFSKSDETPLDTSEYDSLYERSARERKYLLDSISVLDSCNRSLLLERSKLDQELKQVKNRYKTYTPTELEVEMEKRVHGR